MQKSTAAFPVIDTTSKTNWMSEVLCEALDKSTSPPTEITDSQILELVTPHSFVWTLDEDAIGGEFKKGSELVMVPVSEWKRPCEVGTIALCYVELKKGGEEVRLIKFVSTPSRPKYPSAHKSLGSDVKAGETFAICVAVLPRIFVDEEQVKAWQAEQAESARLDSDEEFQRFAKEYREKYEAHRTEETAESQAAWGDDYDDEFWFRHRQEVESQWKLELEEREACLSLNEG